MKSTIKKILAGSFAFVFALALYSNTMYAQGGQSQTPDKAQGKTVVDKVAENENTSQFAGLLEQSGFADVLRQKGTFTVLAPNNKALESSDANLEEVKKDPKKVQKFVQQHLYQGNLPAGEVESSMGVGVKESDDSAVNGTVHVVDKAIQRQ